MTAVPRGAAPAAPAGPTPDPGLWARLLLTDPTIAPAATSLRFAVLMLLVVATTGSIYGYLGLLAQDGAEAAARTCLADVSLPGVFTGDATAASVVLGCTAGYVPTLALWSVAGILAVLGLSGTGYALTPWWRIHVTRPWLPLARRGTGVRRGTGWAPVRPWWIPGPPQRLLPLDPANDRHRAITDRVAVLAGQLGIAAPRCWRHPYLGDTNARAFGHRGRGHVQLDRDLVHLYGVDRPAFDAIVAHELAHLRNRDTRPTHLTFAVRRAFFGVALLPYLVALVAPGLVAHPFGPGAARLAVGWPDPHVVGAVLVLTGVIYLTSAGVLRVRESHADAVAALIVPTALDTLVARRLAAGERRRPELLDDHPRLWRRRRDLAEPHRLAAPDLLAAFGAGLAIGVITVNLWLTTWLGALLQVIIHNGQVTAIADVVVHLRVGQALLLILVIFGPTGVLGLIGVARLAQVSAWRSRLSTPDSRTPGGAVAMAVALTLGLLLGEPASLLYADAGVWGYYDVSLTWTLAEVLGSALTLTLIVLVMFRLAVESAAVAVAAAPRQRRAGIRTTVALVVGAFPAFVVWSVTHATGYIARFFTQRAQPPLDAFFGTDVMFTTYYPLIVLIGLPATGLVWTVSVLVLIGRRRPSGTAPVWLPPPLRTGTRAPALTVVPPWRRLAVAGLSGAAVATGLAVAVMVATWNLVGPDGMRQAVPAGVIAVLEQWLLWITIGVGAIVGVTLGRRYARPVRLAASLVIAYVVATWTGAVGPIVVYLGVCGPHVWACVREQPRTAQIVTGTLAAVAPVEALIVTVLLAGLVTVIADLAGATARLVSRGAGRTAAVDPDRGRGGAVVSDPDRRTPATTVLALAATLALSGVGVVAYLVAVLARS